MVELFQVSYCRLGNEGNSGEQQGWYQIEIDNKRHFVEDLVLLSRRWKQANTTLREKYGDQ